MSLGQTNQMNNNLNLIQNNLDEKSKDISSLHNFEKFKTY